MKAASVVLSRLNISRLPSLLTISTIAIACGLTAGCAGGGATSGLPGKTFSGNTSVMLLATSTANDQLSQFKINFNSITLTDQSGATVNLLTTPQGAEFMHLDGNAEPLVTASVPQGIYTSATATIGGSNFSCVAFVSSANGLYFSTYAYGTTPNSQVTVNLPAPITITGPSMVLTLDMLVSQSATFSSCAQTSPSDTYSINPTFDLTPITLSSQPTNINNGKLTGLDGLIASVNPGASSFAVTAADSDPCPVTNCLDSAAAAVWQVRSNGSTVFQGIASFSALAAGMPVDIDVAIQPDGSLLATRIAVQTTNLTDLSVFSGQAVSASNAEPVVGFFARELEGYLFTTMQGGSGYFSFGNAAFQTSGQFTNIQNLPFSANFNSATIFAGQNVSYSSNASTFSQGPIYIPAATVTLVPQTINGTITAIGNDGGFDTYTVSLAPYDLFPNLAVQPGQTTVLSDPGTVVVYADGSTQMLSSGNPTVGSVMRFNGLMFNDHGTLKMDAAWINDGVAE